MWPSVYYVGYNFNRPDLVEVKVSSPQGIQGRLTAEVGDFYGGSRLRQGGREGLMGNRKLVGNSVLRLEGKEKVTGSLRYLEDLKIQGMLHGKIVRSPVAHARIKSIDASQAERLEGVVTVLTRDDIVDNPHYESHYGPVLRDQTIVAIDKVRHVGDIVAAVVATRREIAEEALDLIEVEYEELPAVMDAEEALTPDAPLLHDVILWPKQGFSDLKDVTRSESTNLANHVHIQKGDVEKGFSEADFVFEDVFESPSAQHATLESFTAIAQFEEGKKLTIWSTVQNPFVIRDQIAEIFHMPLSKVRVLSVNIGGGYGSKLYPKLEPLVAALAFKTGKPVGITLTREEVFQTLTKHAARIYMKTGVRKDGTLIARQCRIFLDTGAYAEIGPRVVKKSAYGVAGPYQIPNVQIDAYCVYTNKVPAGAFRGFGLSQAAWAHESQMDLIAQHLNMDPVELRLKNLLDEGGEFVTGETLHDFGMRECLEKAAQASGWNNRRKEAGISRNCKVRGMGVACVLKATLTPSISSSVVRLNEDGSATVYVASVDIGQGSDTALAQIAGQELEIPLEQITILHSDTETTLYDLTTSSSRSTFHMGKAVQLAAQDVRRQLASMAAARFGVSPDDLVFEEQKVRPKGSSHSGSISYNQILTSHFGIKGANILGKGEIVTRTVNEQGEHQHSAFWIAGTGVAEVEVDTETGMVHLIRYTASADVGKAINPLACRQQLRGAAITGIGLALQEELIYQDGLLINPNFLDYNLPRFMEVPAEIETILVERPNYQGPYGAKGVGETSLIPVAPAIANAVADAVGVRIKQLPITPEKVFRGLQQP